MKNSNLYDSTDAKSKSQRKILRFKDDNKTSSSSYSSSSSFKSYTNKLLLTQVISLVILFTACVLQMVAVCTNDWFHLSTHTKGGLWTFCSISSSSSSSVASTYYSNNFNFYNSFNNGGGQGGGGQSSPQPCMSYEHYGLNQFERLNSSRILLVFTLCLFILVLVCLDVTWCFLGGVGWTTWCCCCLSKKLKKEGTLKSFSFLYIFWPESVIFKVAPWQRGSFGWSPFKPHRSRYRTIAEFILTSCHQTKPVWICPHQHFYELI